VYRVIRHCHLVVLESYHELSQKKCSCGSGLINLVEDCERWRHAPNRKTVERRQKTIERRCDCESCGPIYINQSVNQSIKQTVRLFQVKRQASHMCVYRLFKRSFVNRCLWSFSSALCLPMHLPLLYAIKTYLGYLLRNTDTDTDRHPIRTSRPTGLHKTPYWTKYQITQISKRQRHFCMQCIVSFRRCHQVCCFYHDGASEIFVAYMVHMQMYKSSGRRRKMSKWRLRKTPEDDRKT